MCVRKGGDREGGRERMCIYVVVGACEEHCNLAVCVCVCERVCTCVRVCVYVCVCVYMQ